MEQQVETQDLVEIVGRRFDRQSFIKYAHMRGRNLLVEAAHKTTFDVPTLLPNIDLARELLTMSMDATINRRRGNATMLMLKASPLAQVELDLAIRYERLVNLAQ